MMVEGSGILFHPEINNTDKLKLARGMEIFTSKKLLKEPI
jgi:hypothetical protein